MVPVRVHVSRKLETQVASDPGPVIRKYSKEHLNLHAKCLSHSNSVYQNTCFWDKKQTVRLGWLMLVSNLPAFVFYSSVYMAQGTSSSSKQWMCMKMLPIGKPKAQDFKCMGLAGRTRLLKCPVCSEAEGNTRHSCSTQAQEGHLTFDRANLFAHLHREPYLTLVPTPCSLK